MEYVRVKFRGLSDILGVESKLYLIVLVDEQEMRQLVVTCDEDMRRQFKMRMENMLSGEHLLPEVLYKVLGFEKSLSWEVRIENIKEGVFETKLVNTYDGISFDIRCSDAVLWAFVSHCPIMVNAKLLDQLAVPYSPTATQIALPVNIITDEMLETGLKQAIETENYEAASQIRDELKRRHGEKD